MARREKKRKIKLKVWIPILCVVVVGVTFYMLYDIQTKIANKEFQNTTNPENITQDENQNMEGNSPEEQNVVNEVAANEDNHQENTVANPSADQAKNQNVEPAKPGVTDEKQKAIELVKKEWGADNTVNFVFDHVEPNGEYVVAVKDKASATVKYYFRVNLETKAVELD